MPLDFRYHLASLAAVFAALIIGILLGVAMKEGPVLSNQVEELRKDFRRFDALRNLDSQADQFNIATGALLVRGRLYGRTIALVSNPVFNPAAVADVRRTLEHAGARVTVEITMRPLLHELTPEQISAIYRKMGVAPPRPQQAAAGLMRRLPAAIGAGTDEMARLLEAGKLIRVKGDPAQPVSVIIFLGGVSEEDNYLNDADLPFLRGCIERGVTTVATERMDAPMSLISTYQKFVHYTIDNIDREAGRIALVIALSKDKPGNYGFKSSADKVVPELNLPR